MPKNAFFLVRKVDGLARDGELELDCWRGNLYQIHVEWHMYCFVRSLPVNTRGVRVLLCPHDPATIFFNDRRDAL